MKLWPSRQQFKVKTTPPVAFFAHVQMTYFETMSDFTDQIFDILK